MRLFHTTVLFAAVTALCLTPAHPAQEETKETVEKSANPLVGTWKLLSAKYNGQANSLPAGATQVKHVTPTHFMWAVYDEHGKVVSSLGGPYKLKGDEYVETPEYGVGEVLELKGKPQKFNWKIDGKKWFHTGELSDGLKIEEVWERIEQK